MILIDYKDINEKGIFYGYNFICVSTIILMGAGGILMGLVIKYTDFQVFREFTFLGLCNDSFYLISSRE